jgi:pyridoxamine 5'-phosphate oxidase
MNPIADLRENYNCGELTEDAAGGDPFALFGRWFQEAKEAGIREVNAMTLATVDSEGAPSARIVLLKGVDSGFVFFTNYESAKGRDLDREPRAALCFHWKELERQVRIEGQTGRVTRTESESYFRSRPRGSQIGAWASRQSEAVPDRSVFETSYRELTAAYEGREIPLPPFWGGYRVTPVVIEFWQGRASRLHDRLRYTRRNEAWHRERLSP